MHELPAALGLTRQQTADVLATAGMAPSLHNSQPWRFRLGPRSIALLADPRRRLPEVDPDDRELRIVCATREQLRRLIHAARPPQAVLRIGRGWPVTATPRRPVADLLDRRPTPSLPAR